MGFHFLLVHFSFTNNINGLRVFLFKRLKTRGFVFSESFSYLTAEKLEDELSKVIYFACVHMSTFENSSPDGSTSGCR